MQLMTHGIPKARTEDPKEDAKEDPTTKNPKEDRPYY